VQIPQSDFPDGFNEIQYDFSLKIRLFDIQDNVMNLETGSERHNQ
jgi:hypothetical protein